MKELLYDFKTEYLKILNGEQKLLSPEELLSQFINFISDKVELKGNPVPSLDFDYLHKKVEEYAKTSHCTGRDRYLSCHAFIRWLKENGVETNKEQPFFEKDDKTLTFSNLKKCTCCKEMILADDYYYYGCPHCGENPEDM